MVVPLRKWLRRLVFIVMVAAAAWAFYQVFGVTSAWMEPNKYREPDGKAVKAFRAGGDAPEDESDSVLERLRLFYWYGE